MNNENIKHLNLRLPVPLFQKLAAKAALEDRKPGPFAVLLIEKILKEKDW